MTHRDAEQLDRIIGQMTDAEKQDLVKRLARSLNGGQSEPAPPSEITPDQKKRLTDSFRQIADLPMEGPSGFSSRDNDKVLYGSGSARAGEFGFFDSPSLEDLAAAQGVQPVADTAQLYGEFWPESETVDDFLEARRSWRAEG